MGRATEIYITTLPCLCSIWSSTSPLTILVVVIWSFRLKTPRLCIGWNPLVRRQAHREDPTGKESRACGFKGVSDWKRSSLGIHLVHIDLSNLLSSQSFFGKLVTVHGNQIGKNLTRKCCNCKKGGWYDGWDGEYRNKLSAKAIHSWISSTPISDNSMLFRCKISCVQ